VLSSPRSPVRSIRSADAGRSFPVRSGGRHRSALHLPEPFRAVPTLHGVASTFSVSRPSVAARLALRPRLRPFRLTAWTLASSAGPRRRLVSLPALLTAPGLALALEDRSRFPEWASGSAPNASPSFHPYSPGFFAPAALPARGVRVPVRPSFPGLRRSAPAVPRRGIPLPRRSASAVSHDPGGLLLLGPGGVFRPLTPLGFVPLASPLAPSRPSRPCGRTVGPRGVGS
jgi:hypothetical protein